LPRYFYLDASALAKRYTPELGTLVINRLFSRVPTHRIFVPHLGVAEVVSIFSCSCSAMNVRRRFRFAAR
jgi:hypothetical protein